MAMNEDQVIPKLKGPFGFDLTLYEGFWCSDTSLPSVIALKKKFKPLDNDIIIASNPKSGTTWLKALLFCIINRKKYPNLSQSPLVTLNPHKLVPFLEYVYAEDGIVLNRRVDLNTMESPRLFNTHIHFASLPESIKQSNSCRIVYVCRNPFDILVSYWLFVKAQSKAKHVVDDLQEFVDIFCKGEIAFGPFWKHVLEYWEESLKNPEKVLFLRFEDLKEDCAFQLKKIAEFVGFPFSQEEEKNGVVEEIVRLCSIKNLKDLDANKQGTFDNVFENKTFFRKGEVGDWINHLDPSMVEKLNRVIQEKFSGSGLEFKVSP